MAWCDRKTNWKFGLLLFDCTIVVMRLKMIFLRLLPKTGGRLMGLYEERFSGDLPGLSTVTMTDDFQESKINEGLHYKYVIDV